MSRIGNNPITIPTGVTVTADKTMVTVTGPKGTLSRNIPTQITVEVKDNQVIVARVSESKVTKANHGTTRAHINNMVQGVVNGYQKDLEVRGTGYKETKITVTGIDKTIVGQVASNIRKIRTPEPYKGKGVRYTNEVIKLKAGKTAKA